MNDIVYIFNGHSQFKLLVTKHVEDSEALGPELPLGQGFPTLWWAKRGACSHKDGDACPLL